MKKFSIVLLCAYAASGVLCQAKSKGREKHQQNRTNVIAGNKGNGVAILNGSHDNVIQKALIGVTLCKKALGNQKGGVFIAYESDNNQIGGERSEANVIAHNKKGVIVGSNKCDGSDGNSIEGNSIYANDKLAIDLANDGPTPNHKKNPVPHAPNGFQNFPEFTIKIENNQAVAQGSLTSALLSRFKLEFFAQEEDHGCVTGVQQLVATTEVTTDAQGKASFTVTLPTVKKGSAVSATATALEGPRNTSELSPQVTVCEPKTKNKK